MAEVTPASTGKKPGGRRSKKLSTRVDLTPMVDLGFLLITFFIFTTTMSTPKAVKLAMPDDTKPVDKDMNVGESAALTVLPLKDNKVFYYHGNMDKALQSGSFGVTTYAFNDGIGQIIRDKQAAMDRAKPGFRKDLTLMIKPTDQSSYKNVVEMLDEVAINIVPHYAIMEVSKEEKNMLLEKKIGL